MTASSISPVASFGLTFTASRSTTVPQRADHVLGAQRVRGWRVPSRRALGVEDELDDPGAVAQVDEDQAAVVTAAMDPAGDASAGVPARAAVSSPHQASR